MRLIADLCRTYDAIAITDEIYEHLVYEGEHVRMATLPGMEERTVTIGGLSKTYSLTGWRGGGGIAPPHPPPRIRKGPDLLPPGAAPPRHIPAAQAPRIPHADYQ